MTVSFKTTDLYDDYLEELQVAAPIFRDFGGRSSFCGQIVTMKAFEDNTCLKAAFETDGRGKVLVVDSGASLRCAMMGDVMAALGASNGWEGVVINGCIRDSADVGKVDFGAKALATIPRKTVNRYQSSGSGVVLRYHLHSDAWRFCVSDGGHGLAQPLCVGL